MRVVFETTAEDDVFDAVLELRARYSQKTADDFLTRLERTLNFLSLFPYAASLFRPRIPGYPHLRARTVHRFRGRVIYYEVRGETVRVIRVLLARRHFRRAFADSRCD